MCPELGIRFGQDFGEIAVVIFVAVGDDDDVDIRKDFASLFQKCLDDGEVAEAPGIDEDRPGADDQVTPGRAQIPALPAPQVGDAHTVDTGAFAGAVTKSIGKFEFAGSGTVFLDEIGDMSLQTQAKILRVLQELKFQRVGGTRTLEMKARLIVASNKDLEREIEKGSFREDLYFRLNVIPIEVPPLRDRYEDIPILVETFMTKFVGQYQREPKTLTPEAMELLASYSWPGNIRELKNLLERLAIMVQSNTIDVSDIPSPYNPALVEKQKKKELNFFSFSKLKDAKQAFEDEFIRRKLLANDNDASKTAKEIGVDGGSLKKKLKKLV